MLTEEEKAGLSEDEITAIEGDQTDDEPTDDNEEDIDDDATDDDTDDTEEEADPKPKVDDAEEEEPVAEEYDADMSEAPFVSPGAIRYTDAVRPDIKDQLDTLREEYEAGDKELAEYEAAKRKLDADNMNWQAGTQMWDAEQAAFMDKFAGYKAPGALRSALEGEIGRIDRASGNSLSGMQLLMAAKQSVEKTFNIANDVAPVKSKAKADKRPKAKRPSSDVHAIEHAAPAGEQGTGGSEFANMENMNGLELESAVAKMTDEQRDRWYRNG